MLNQYRKIKDLNDGCIIFECLACKHEFKLRDAIINFCNNCGILFSPQLIWNETKRSPNLDHLRKNIRRI